MIRRSTWIVLVVFALVLAGAVYWQRTQATKNETGVEGSAEATSSVPQPVFDFTEDMVLRLQVDAAGGRSVVLVSAGNGEWQLALPQAEQTDSSAVAMAVRQIVAMTSMATLATPPALQSVGLEPPAYVVTLGLMDGRKVTVNVGKATQIGDGFYIQLDQGPVQVVSRYEIDMVLDLVENPPIVTPQATATVVPATGSPALQVTPGEITPGAITPDLPKDGTVTAAPPTVAP